MPFVKLDCGILDSTLWVEDASVRVTFITILAMADAGGLVAATAPGIARRANLDLASVRRALEVLESPDHDSRSLNDEGRRIERVDGGYQVINYLKYRKKDQTNAERQKRWRERQNQEDEAPPVTRYERYVTGGVTEAEAEAEADKDIRTNVRMSGKPDESPPKNGKDTDAARRVLEFLNSKTGRAYQPVPANLNLIRARLREYDEMTLRKVIVRKARDWAADDKMAPYLRPATLFNASKCAQYVGELVVKEGE